METKTHRLKRVTYSAKKRRKSEESKRKRQRTVNIRNNIEDWNIIKAENNLDNDGDVAKFLIKCYHESQVHVKRKRRKFTSTPAAGQGYTSGSSVGVSSVSLDRDVSLMSGLEEIDSAESERDSRKQHVADAPVRKIPVQTVKKSTMISFEEVSELDAGELYDIDDLSYMPSEWEISITVPEPDTECAAGMVDEEDDINASIHDIDEVEDLPDGPTTTTKQPLKDVDRETLEDAMYVVAQANIMELASMLPLTTCKRCTKPVEVTKKRNGSAVLLNWVCADGHVAYAWASQPVLRHGTMLGNIRLLSAILLSGNNYKKMALLFKFANIGMPSTSSFNSFQSHYLVPTISQAWAQAKAVSQEELRATNVVVAGDGRMDSPGHCAKYCTYTVMDNKSKNIISMEIVDKRETQLISNRMEAAGFQRALTDIKEAGILVQEVVTDAHPQISSIMKKQHPQIRHSWDMWHGAKNLGKKLCAVCAKPLELSLFVKQMDMVAGAYIAVASQEKRKDGLKPWISPVTNQFFYAAEHCQGDEMKLKTKLVSVLNHCTNVHEWALGSCDHEELAEEERDKEWLNPAGVELKALRTILMNARFQRNLKYYVTCQTTSELESFNNHLLMYAPKRMAFTYGVYKCRCQLAALDYMMHLNRPYKKNTKGELCYNRKYSKAANHWCVVAEKEKKPYKYIGDIMMDVVQMFTAAPVRLRHKVPRVEGDPVAFARTIAPVEPPSTKEMVEHQKHRIATWMPVTSGPGTSGPGTSGEPGTSSDD